VGVDGEKSKHFCCHFAARTSRNKFMRQLHIYHQSRSSFEESLTTCAAYFEHPCESSNQSSSKIANRKRFREKPKIFNYETVSSANNDCAARKHHSIQVKFVGKSIIKSINARTLPEMLSRPTSH
jgi:hypothetical protein